MSDMKDIVKHVIKDKQGEFRMIDKNLLRIDKKYQRDTREARVKKIASNWSWAAFGALSVADRNGDYYVFEGQHRAAAAMKRDEITELPCMVFQMESEVKEAEGFLTSNTVRCSMRAIEKFKALIETNNKEAKILQELIEGSGRRITVKSSSASVACVAILMRFARLHPETLKRVWPLVATLCEGRPIIDRIVSGLVYLETQMPYGGASIMDKYWSDRILRLGYDEIDRGAKQGAVFYVRGSNKAWGMGILQVINHGSKKRLVLKTKVDKKL